MAVLLVVVRGQALRLAVEDYELLQLVQHELPVGLVWPAAVLLPTYRSSTFS